MAIVAIIMRFHIYIVTAPYPLGCHKVHKQDPRVLVEVSGVGENSVWSISSAVARFPPKKQCLRICLYMFQHLNAIADLDPQQAVVNFGKITSLYRFDDS